MMTASSAQPPTCTVYYDGGCPLCSAEIATYRKLAPEGVVEFRDVTQGETPLPAHLSREALLARFTVTTADGATHDGARGFIALWKAMPKLAWLGRIASVPPLPQGLEIGYRIFLSVRRLWRR